MRVCARCGKNFDSRHLRCTACNAKWRPKSDFVLFGRRGGLTKARNQQKMSMRMCRNDECKFQFSQGVDVCPACKTVWKPYPWNERRQKISFSIKSPQVAIPSSKWTTCPIESCKRAFLKEEKVCPSCSKLPEVPVPVNKRPRTSSLGSETETEEKPPEPEVVLIPMEKPKDRLEGILPIGPSKMVDAETQTSEQFFVDTSKEAEDNAVQAIYKYLRNVKEHYCRQKYEEFQQYFDKLKLQENNISERIKVVQAKELELKEREADLEVKEKFAKHRREDAEKKNKLWQDLQVMLKAIYSDPVNE